VTDKRFVSLEEAVSGTADGTIVMKRTQHLT